MHANKTRNKVKLIQLEKKHFSLFYKWWNDGDLRKLTSESNKPISKKEIEEILGKHLVNRMGFDFIITVNNKPVGHILIQRKRTKKNWEVYIAIGEKKYWGRGFGTAAMKKACGWFFKKFPKEKRIFLEVLTNNFRAIRSYKKAGFKKIRIVHNKKFSDTVLMRKDRRRLEK